MKYISLVIMLALYGAAAKAECSGNGIWCWPSGSTIKSNPIIAINFYAESQNYVPHINSKYSVYLKSGKKKIPLNVMEICKGEFYLTQVIFKPSELLVEGEDYQLIIDSLPAYEDKIQRWNSKTGKSELVKWTVQGGQDTEVPKWTRPPVYNSKTLIHYGCGPAKWVYFDFGSDDKSDILIKTVVKSVKTGKITTYYLEPDKNKVKVGHGMCSGAFHFDQEGEYEVIFSLMDASGNSNTGNTKPIRFTEPTETKTE